MIGRLLVVALYTYLVMWAIALIAGVIAVVIVAAGRTRHLTARTANPELDSPDRHDTRLEAEFYALINGLEDDAT